MNTQPNQQVRRLPPKVVVTWETPDVIGGPGAVQIEAFASVDRLALPLGLSPEQQRELLNITADSLAQEKLAKLRTGFTMMLGMVEYVAERLKAPDGSIRVDEDGKPLVSEGFLNGLATFQAQAPSADAPPEGAPSIDGEVGG